MQEKNSAFQAAILTKISARSMGTFNTSLTCLNKILSDIRNIKYKSPWQYQSRDSLKEYLIQETDN
jgi:hypothetical protein